MQYQHPMGADLGTFMVTFVLGEYLLVSAFTKITVLLSSACR